MNLKLLLLIIFSHCCLFLFSQNGVYRTYEDYLNNKLDVSCEGTARVSHIMGNFILSFRDSKKNKIKYNNIKGDNLWGYKSFHRIYRFNKRGNPFYVIGSGKIYTYTIYDSGYGSDGTLKFERNQFSPQMSIGENGEMITISKKNLKIIFKDDPFWLAKVKKTSKGYQSCFDFIHMYNSH